MARVCMYVCGCAVLCGDGCRRDRHSVALLLMDFASKWCILQQQYPLSVSDKLLDLPSKQPDAVYTVSRHQPYSRDVWMDGYCAGHVRNVLAVCEPG